MYITELLILIGIVLFVFFFRNYNGQSLKKFSLNKSSKYYSKFSNFSYSAVKEKAKELGRDFTFKEFLVRVVIIGGAAAVISYLYFYNIVITLIYIAGAICLVPYITYLNYKREYSEFIFEQIQVYTSNVIMEFATTQSFVKALEGVRDSGLLEDPVLSDVNKMIDMAYTNGSIDESLDYMSKLYPYYIVKNMHQLFLQITKEGARNYSDSLENMQLDIDTLVEGVYRDRVDRESFHKKFLLFGIGLYFLVLTVQFLLGRETYIKLVDQLFVRLLIHAVFIINTYFLLKGEKYYNENVGGE